MIGYIWNIPTTLKFVFLSSLAAGSFFLASISALLFVGIDRFAEISVALALGTVVGAIFQFGAAFAIPASARTSDILRDTTFWHLVFFSVFASILGLIIVALIQIPMNFKLGIVLGFAIGLQLICDSQLRSNNRLVFLGSINASLHISFCILIFYLGVSGLLTEATFLALVILIKLSFVTAMIIGTKPLYAQNIKNVKMSSLSGIKTSAPVFLLYLLGVTDLLVFKILHIDASHYISLRHFAYGLFILFVQENAVPILVSNLSRKKDPSIGSFIAFSLGLALFASVVAGATIFVVEYFRSGMFVNSKIVVAVLCFISSLSLVTLAVNLQSIVSRISFASYLIGALGICLSLVLPLKFNSLTILFVVLILAMTYLAISSQIVIQYSVLHKPKSLKGEANVT